MVATADYGFKEGKVAGVREAFPERSAQRAHEISTLFFQLLRNLSRHIIKHSMKTTRKDTHCRVP